MLYDKNFLLKLDKCKNKIIYARITALTFDENPIQSIEGRVTQGSINIDGASAVRRTCSLTIVGQDFDYNDYYWGLSTKFKLEVGVQNTVDSSYPDIIWFKQGIYLITTFNTSRSTNNFSISISGKDKMCLLNGEVSGAFEASIDFGQIEEQTLDNTWTIKKITIPEIIKNLVHTYGKEPLHNIVINDLDIYGKELLEYRLEIPAYIYKTVSQTTFNNILLEGNKKFYLWTKSGNTYAPVKSGTNQIWKALDKMTDDKFDLLIDSLIFDTTQNYYFTETNATPTDSTAFQFAKIRYGDTLGYRKTELTYPGDLIANIGESITSILDKIKNMLVEFEYFYDLDGRFVFQKRKNYIQTLWGPENENEEDQKPIMNYMSGTADYVFSGGELITTFNNNPNLLNLKNDFSIWGERQAVSGIKVPVHLRYAIDNKPTRYTSIEVTENDTIDYCIKNNIYVKPQTSTIYSTTSYDWREIIYQMAKDYYQYNFLDDFELRVAAANQTLFPSGKTGYENYYIDIYSFWRDLYYIQETLPAKETLSSQSETLKSEIQTLETQINTLKEEIKSSTNQSTINAKKTEKANKERTLKIKKLKQKYIIGLYNTYEEKSNAIDEKSKNYYPSTNTRKYWNKAVYEYPETLNFWFDFLDTDGELKQFGVKSIGSRSKSIKDTEVKAIYFRDTPEIQIGEDVSTESEISGYSYIQVPEDYQNIFSISGKGKSAKERLDELIYEHSYCIESATINAIPIYYLEPNSRVHIDDEKTGIIGYYNISKITLPLTYNGTMSLTATKVHDR